MKLATFDIQDMTCGHCVKHVTEALRRLDGVEVRNVAVGSAEVRFDPARTSSQAIADAIGAAGYPANQRGGAADRLACRPDPGPGGGGCCCG